MIRKMSAILLVLIFMFSFTVTGIGAVNNSQEYCEGEYEEVAKYELNGSYTAEYGGNIVTVTGNVYDKGSGGTWESTVPIYKIVIKGGVSDDDVRYLDGELSGSFDNSNLLGPEGQLQDISNIIFYTCDDPLDDPTGQIEIVKVLLDEEGVEITDDDTHFTATITPEVAVDWFSVNNSWLSGDLAVGDYTVEEVVHDDYDFVSIDPADGEVTVEENETVTVTITNQVKPEDNGDPEGTLEVTKVVYGDYEGDSFEYTIYYDDDGIYDSVVGLSDIEIDDGETKTHKLTPGYYWIAETEDRNADTVNYNGAANGDGYTFEIIDGETTEVTITNTFDEVPQPATGQIEIVKVLLDEEGVEITDDDTHFTATITPAVAVDWFSVNDSWFSGDLAVGDYTVEEVVHADYDIVSIDPADGEVTVIEDEIVTVTITNQVKSTITVTPRTPATRTPTTTTPTTETTITEEPEPTETEPFTPVRPAVPPVDEPEVEIITPEEPAVEPEEEVIVVREEPAVEPERELPRTGGFEFLFMGLGGALAGAGAFLKLRGRKK